jgi:hypothetical protein
MSIIAFDSIAQSLTQVCERHHVIRVRVFGSSAAGNARPDSDVDLLVDYDPAFTPTFFTMEQLERDLSPIFNGRPIDLMRPEDVHWFIRRSILSSARTLYER